MRKIRNHLVVIVCLLAGALTQAAPTSLSYQGRILKADGTPLGYNNVSFIFQLKGGPNAQCLIYQEQVNGIDLSSSGGVFDVPIGTGTVYYPTGGSFTVLDAFNNSDTFNCGSCTSAGSTVTCGDSGSSYTPNSDDSRVLVVQFYDGTGWQKISPSTTIRSVPFAGYALSAQKLGNNFASDFVLKNNINNGASCNGGSFLTWDASLKKFSCASVSAGGGGTVQSVTASAGSSPYLSVSADMVNPVITLQVGTTAGTLAAGNDGRLVHAVQDSSTAGGDVTGTFANLSVGKISGVDLQFTALADGQYLKYSGGKWINSMPAVSDISGLATQLANKLDVSQMPATCGAAQTLTYVSPSNTWTCLDLSISESNITGPISGSKISGDLSAVGNIIQIDGKVLKLSSNSSNPAVSGAGDKGKIWFDSVANQIKFYDGSAIRTLASNSQFPTCGVNQYLTYDGTTFTCGNDSGASGTVASLTSGTAALTFSASTGSITANITTASAGVSGLLSGTDWTAFNSKMDKSLSAGSLWVGNASNIPTPVLLSGDATLSTSGVLTIANSAITDVKVSSSAGIARSKLANGAVNRLVVNNAGGVMSDAAAIAAQMALISDANGIPTQSTVTAAQLGYLSAVTSDVQTQLNDKVDLTSAQTIGGLKTFQPAVAANTGLIVKGATSQTANLQEWQSSAGAVLSSVDATGKFNLSSLQMATGAGPGKVLTSDASGNASWAVNSATDIAGLSTTGIVQRNGVGSYSTVTVSAPLTYSSGVLGVSMALDDLTDAVSDSGSTNLGLGSTALSAVTSGYATTAVGIGALSAMTSGNENTAVGMNAMHGLTSGWQSTAVGAAAFDSGTAARTTAIGAYSLRAASGTGNTSLGYGALQGVTSGSYNTGLGYSAGGLVSTGSNNIFVGSAAGSNLTTGSGNIVIGNNINAPAGASTNTLNIGNLIYGTALDGSGGTLSTGNVGIGKVTPGYKLDVAGDVNITGAFRVNGVVISSGTVTGVSSANSDISVVNGTSAAVLTLNSGTTGGAGDANKMAKLDGSGLLSVGMIPSIATSKITGVLPVANGGTNSSTALANNRVMASSGGAIVEAAAITASRALVSDTNGIPTHSTVTATQLGYLSTVTSDVQTQINSKASSTGWANYSVIGVNGSGALTAFPGAVNGSILQYSATGPVWSALSFPSTTTANQLLYSSSSNVVGGLATANSAVLTTDSSGVPVWSALASDSFAQYALLAGRAGGQILYGGNAASKNLTLDSTSSATKGAVILQPTSGNVGIGTATPAGKLTIQDSGVPGIQIKTTGAAAVDTINLINDMNANGEFRIAKGSTANASPAAADQLVNITNEGNVEIYGQAVTGANDKSGVLSLKTEASAVGGTRNEVSMEFYADRTNLNNRTGFIGFESNTAFDLTLQNDKNGNMIFSTYGTERMRISGAGNVGIGTANPGAKLHVADGTVAFESTTNDANGAMFSFWKHRNYSAVQTNDDLGYFNYYGHDGSGLQRAAYIAARVTAAPNSVTHRIPTALQFWTTDTNSDIAERVRITSDGSVGVGTQSPAYKLDVVGDINASGTVRAAGTALTSDIRFKRDIQTLDGALAKVLRLRGVSYSWRREEFPGRHFNDRHQIGVIAQEVEKEFPEAVETNPDGYKAVNYPALVSPLIESTKELYGLCKASERQTKVLDRQVASLDARVQKLENENAVLRQDNEALRKDLELIKQKLGIK